MMDKRILENEIHGSKEEAVGETNEDDIPVDWALERFPDLPLLINWDTISPDHREFIGKLHRIQERHVE